MADSTLARVRNAGGTFARMYDSVANPINAIQPYAKSTVHLIRSQSEAAFTGIAVAALKHKMLGGSLVYKGLAVDGLLAAAGIIATIGLSTDGDGLHVDARNVSADLTCLYTNRLADEFFSKKEKQESKSSMNGDQAFDALMKELG